MQKKVIKKPYWRRAAHTFSACLNQNISSSSVTHNYPYTGNEWKNEWIKPRTITARKIFMAVYVPLLSLLCYNFFFQRICARHCRQAIVDLQMWHRFRIFTKYLHTHTHQNSLHWGERERERGVLRTLHIYCRKFICLNSRIWLARDKDTAQTSYHIILNRSWILRVWIMNNAISKLFNGWKGNRLLHDTNVDWLSASCSNETESKKNINNQLFYR